MSKLFFVKFQGAGNDFILIDDRALTFDTQLVSKLCHRKFGIGADGVILLQPHREADFQMRIFNADGSEAAMCGNGLRCLMRFLLHLGLPQQAYRIAAGARIVNAYFTGNQVAIQLGMVANVKRLYICGHEVHSLDTGVPHAVVFTGEPLEVLGPLLQTHPAFLPAQTNVNVAQIHADGIHVRTYERGVGETLACGTGAAAVGYIACQQFGCANPCRIYMPGGELQVGIEGSEVTLIGDALKVFEGIYPAGFTVSKACRQ